MKEAEKIYYAYFPHISSQWNPKNSLSTLFSKAIYVFIHDLGVGVAQLV
jgi:hypothetical protein